jgi:hypothetical protein
MGPIMRRAFILCAVLGPIASGLGCKVVTGTCDCHYVPENSVLKTPDGRAPYPTAGGTVSHTVVTPSATAMPAPAPEAAPMKEKDAK